MATALPHLTVLLAVLADHPDGLTPDQLLEAMADRGTTISRPTLNRVLVQGRDAGKLVASGLTTGRTYRLAEASDQPTDRIAGKVSEDIVSAYGSKVWDTADVLRGVGIKQSEWSGHMMPFFALMLLESRVLRLRNAAMDDLFDGGKTFDRTNRHHLSDLRDYYLANTPSTNSTRHDDLLITGEGLAHLADGGASGIEGRLEKYLEGYDGQTQILLGCSKTTQERFLGINATISTLARKGSQHLLQWAKQWAKVDLSNYDSSDITTLEEHIKRKWADISADTAGEHYTPFDLFRLVADLAADHFERHPVRKDHLKVYDPTCGGGNMLFGVADRLRELATAQGTHLTVKALGQEINDTLYALAAVEARFLANADIRYGNTLTADQFTGERFDLIIANPPYGVDWKGISDDIEKDATGRFPKGCRPPVSDGQHLFLQHILDHLDEGGLAFAFSSGSPLFSGDAGGGESNARLKYFVGDDHVLGVIQLPKDEFFNTGINTYLWIFKKNKPGQLKRRAFFLDATGLATKLRKSLGSKRNELAEDARRLIVQLVREAEEKADELLATPRGDDGRRIPALGLAKTATGSEGQGSEVGIVDAAQQPPLLRLLSVDETCYNKLDLELTRGNPAMQHDLSFEDAIMLVLGKGVSVEEAEALRASGKHNPGLRLFSEMDLDEAIGAVAKFEVELGEALDLDDRIQEFQGDPKSLVAGIKALLLEKPVMTIAANQKNGKRGRKAVRGGDEPQQGDEVVSLAWNFPGNPQERSLVRIGQEQEQLGRAAPTVNIKIKPGKNGKGDTLTIGLSYGPDTEKDSETIPFSSDPKQNQAFQDTFLARWISDQYQITKQVVGCEVNFNRLFPKTGERKTLAQINAELAALDARIAGLHKEGA